MGERVTSRSESSGALGPQEGLTHSSGAFWGPRPSPVDEGRALRRGGWDREAVSSVYVQQADGAVTSAPGVRLPSGAQLLFRVRTAAGVDTYAQAGAGAGFTHRVGEESVLVVTAGQWMEHVVLPAALADGRGHRRHQGNRAGPLTVGVNRGDPCGAVQTAEIARGRWDDRAVGEEVAEQPAPLVAR